MLMRRSMGLLSVVLAVLESSLVSFVFLIRLNRIFLVFFAALMAVDRSIVGRRNPTRAIFRIV